MRGTRVCATLLLAGLCAAGVWLWQREEPPEPGPERANGPPVIERGQRQDAGSAPTPRIEDPWMAMNSQAIQLLEAGH